MATFRVPVHLQDTGKAFTVQRWVDHRTFPKEDYFRCIDKYKESIRAITTNEPSNASLAAILAQTIDTEGSLDAHALKSGNTISDDEAWGKIALAAAWVILQRYTTAVEKGEWPK